MGQTIGVLAVQGAFAEHVARFKRLGCTCVELRQASDLDKPFDRLVLPGGESTVQSKLLAELGMRDVLRERIEAGMPVMGTCAGVILLAAQIAGGPPCGCVPYGAEAGAAAVDAVSSGCFATMPIVVRRNAYGRQLGSFHGQAGFAGIGNVAMTFIRAPVVVEAGEGVEVLARIEDDIVAVRYGNQLGTAFHPELDEDDRVLELFLSLG